MKLSCLKLFARRRKGHLYARLLRATLAAEAHLGNLDWPFSTPVTLFPAPSGHLGFSEIVA